MLYYVAEELESIYLYDSKEGDLKEYESDTLLGSIRDGLEVMGIDKKDYTRSDVIGDMLYFSYEYAYVCTSSFISIVSMMDLVYIKDNIRYHIDLDENGLVYHGTDVLVSDIDLQSLSYMLSSVDRIWLVDGDFTIFGSISIDDFKREYAEPCDMNKIRRKLLVSDMSNSIVL